MIQYYSLIVVVVIDLLSKLQYVLICRMDNVIYLIIPSTN